MGGITAAYDAGFFTITVTPTDQLAIVKRFNWTKTVAGATGPTGRSVVTIVDEYYLSTSASSATGGSWSITMPTWEPSRWIWTRQNITWSTAPTSTQTTAALAGAINTAAETAHSANATAASAQSAAATASTDAANAVNKVNDIADDNKITPDEKYVLAKEWEIIKGEKPLNEAQATTFTITTEKTAYTNAYNALNTYLNTTYPILTNLTTTTAIASGSAMRALYKTYYDAKTVLLNLIAVKAADKAQSSAEEYARTYSAPVIMGTQIASTSAWTGVAPFPTLADGQQITYWLPWASKSTSVTLNLTLSGGTTTGNINCYYGGTSRLTTQYATGNAVRLVYKVNAPINGTNYTGWWADANYVGSDTYDRTRVSGAIKAGTGGVTASRFVVADDTGYRNLAVGSIFDITKPILWTTTAVAAGASSSSAFYYVYPTCPIAQGQTTPSTN